MTKIILGSLLMVLLVSTLTGIILAKEALRGWSTLWQPIGLASFEIPALELVALSI